MYGSDPLGLLSWRFQLDEAGYGVTSDLLSHSVDLAHMLLGPITRVVGTTETFITERPLALPAGRTTAAAAPGDPTGAVTNEDYAGMLCEFASGARGTFEASRTIIGPESQMAFDVYGTQGRARLEPREAQRAAALPGRGRARHRLPDRLRRRPLPVPRALRPRQRQRDRLRGPRGDRGLRVLPLGRRAGARTRRASREAVEWVSVQAALLKSAQTGAGSPSYRCGRTDGDDDGDRRPLRVGVIGVGRIGRMHAELLARQVARRDRRRRPRRAARRRGAALDVPVAATSTRCWPRPTSTRSRSARAPTRTPT